MLAGGDPAGRQSVGPVAEAGRRHSQTAGATASYGAGLNPPLANQAQVLQGNGLLKFPQSSGADDDDDQAGYAPPQKSMSTISQQGEITPGTVKRIMKSL